MELVPDLKLKANPLEMLISSSEIPNIHKINKEKWYKKYKEANINEKIEKKSGKVIFSTQIQLNGLLHKGQNVKSVFQHMVSA